jgi:PAS domain S-box-containing protein
MNLSVLLMPLVGIEPVAFLAKLANPLLLLGHLLLYVGILKFIGKRAWPRPLVGFYACFLLAYYYCIYGVNTISGRAVVVSGALAVVCWAAVGQLLVRPERTFLASARVTAAALGAEGAFMAVRCVATLVRPPIPSYTAQDPTQIAGFLVPITTNMLWTFGLILMVNQRLNEQLDAERIALRESEATYRSILDASPDDITISSMDGRILMVSPGANEMFGYPPGAEVGMGLLDFIVPEDRQLALERLRRATPEAPHRTTEYRGLRRDGKVFDIEVNSGLIRNPRGEPGKRVFIIRDISERRQAEADRASLAQRNQQLRKAESLGRMAGAVAHLFNNHLQAVTGNLDLLAGSMDGQARERWIAGARQALEKATRVSRLMLVYLGQIADDQEPCRLTELCRGALPDLLDRAPGNAAIHSNFPAPGPVIRAAAPLVRDILGNLVTNAWEALGGAPGSIHLVLSTCPAEAIPAAHRFPVGWQPKAPKYACLSVADTGGGIPEADLEKVFEPFYTTRFTGRGLGLPVVLGIAQAHGGAVVVAGAPGGGTVFQVYFPEQG